MDSLAQSDLINAIVDLDMVLLKDHTEAAGVKFEREAHYQAVKSRFGRQK
ncbi:hypothetical protein [Maritalea sp.]